VIRIPVIPHAHVPFISCKQKYARRVLLQAFVIVKVGNPKAPQIGTVPSCYY